MRRGGGCPKELQRIVLDLKSLPMIEVVLGQAMGQSPFPRDSRGLDVELLEDLTERASSPTGDSRISIARSVLRRSTGFLLMA